MPIASASLKIILIWEHEIVAAVKAFDRLRRKKEPTKEEIAAAFKAAYTALYHPEILDGNPFVIMSANRDILGLIDKTDPEPSRGSE